MANWLAFVDESGDTGGEIFSLSMYIIREFEADNAQRRWLRRLRKAKIGCFHMVDCAHHKREFTRLSKQDAASLEVDLISIINRYLHFGISLIFKPRMWDFDDIVFLKIYPMAVIHLIEQACDMIRGIGPQDSISFYFESGHSEEKTAKQAIPRALNIDRLVQGRKPTFNFCRKDEQPLLQAADILAWQSQKYIKTMREDEFRVRRDAMALFQLPHRFQIIYTQGENDINIMNISNPAKELDTNAQFIRAVFGKGDDHLLRTLHERHDKYGPQNIPGWKGLRLAFRNQT